MVLLSVSLMVLPILSLHRSEVSAFSNAQRSSVVFWGCEKVS